VKFFVWDTPYLFKHCSDQVFRRCIPYREVTSVLSFIDQAYRRLFNGRRITTKVLQCSYCWSILFGDAFEYCKNCPRCQQLGKISRRDMTSLNPIIVVDITDVSLDFMGSFSFLFFFFFEMSIFC